MSLKSEKLANRIQEIQQFVTARIAQNDTFQAVFQELAKIADSLRQGKLTVQIVSRDSTPAQALQNFLNDCKPLLESYHFQTIPLPEELEQAEPQPTAALILQASSASTTGLQQTRYQLPANQRVVIGRDVSQCQICLPNQYGRVSGRHAEIRSLLNSDTNNTEPYWQICDLNSRNGIYINGQQLQERQVLQLGDRITLGYNEPIEKSPEFIFEYQSDNDEFYRQLVDCDVLCLVVDPSQMLLTNEKLLIEKTSKSQIALLVVVVEIPEPLSKPTQQIETSMAEVMAWLQSQNSDPSFKLAPLLLRLFYPDAQEVEVDSSRQKELDKLCKSLETLVKRKPEDILVERLTAKVLSQIALIECFFKETRERYKERKSAR